MALSRKNHIATIISAGILVLSVFFYFLLQNTFIYDHVGSCFIKNYYHEDNIIARGDVPYEAYEGSKMLHWDAQLYFQIKENGYDMQSAGGDYIFAFFPLFPLIWKITHMSSTMILFFNYLLYVISIVLIIKCFHTQDVEKRNTFTAIAICTPMLVVFLIPYSEGIFMLTATIALWSIYKNRYTTYFIAALFMSMTRPSVTIIGVALLFSEIYFWFEHRKLTVAFRSFVFKMLPLIFGVLIVSLIQLAYGSASLFKFIEVQKYWGFQLQFPQQLTDWAHEQFGTNVSLLVLLLPASTVYLGYHVLRNIFNKTHGSQVENYRTAKYRKEYIFVFSLIYILGTILSILFFRGGSLNGISRYILCTPFYYITLFMLNEKLTDVKAVIKGVFFISFFIFTAIVLSVSKYSGSWNFADVGFILFYTHLSFFVFTKLARNKWLVAFHVIFTAIWTSYLFNMFISDAWIFT